MRAAAAGAHRGGAGRRADVAACVYCVIGVYVFFILFGIAQERINTREYGDERFVHTLALVFCQVTTNVSLAAVALRLSPTAHKRSYMDPLAVGKLATSYIGAMFCSNLALQFISYPTQVLIKSCKMVPVMAANMLMGIAHYSHAAKLRVLLLTTGICAFLLAKPAAHERSALRADADADADRTQLTGLALALASLACDGYTGGAQDRLVHAVRPSSHQLMLWTNLWAVVLLAIALVVTGQGVLAARFAARHPEMVGDLALFCGTSALGQNFIYFSIARFGALPTAVITTTRKFFTILASVLWFGHPLGFTQWLAIALVFGALGSELHQKVSGGLGGAGAHHALALGERRPGERRGSDASSIVEFGQLTDGERGDAAIGMLSAPPSEADDGEAMDALDGDDDGRAGSGRRVDDAARALEAGRAPAVCRPPFGEPGASGSQFGACDSFETVRLLDLVAQRSGARLPLP
ncbi:hypothetical protein KFE25_002042 [Diacronema lutheri]|uniref:Uncharacterized protein n=2 Tax=Diacronema lutheri TaxID=2081491 RepID=A0A8J5XCR7_DIALT|nr:hypothetical protein KFE25_002042 [Diacronema lutheri]